MNQTSEPPSKLRIACTWVLMVGIIVAISTFYVWRSRDTTTPDVGKTPAALHSVIFVIIGGIGIFVGLALYSITIASHCFTYNFKRPVWPALKGKIFLANLIVPLVPAIGLGILLAGLIEPVLSAMGLRGGVANILPFMVIITLLQIFLLWFQIWAPIEKGIIRKRLLELGITEAQLTDSACVGISNPAAGTLKRMGTIEEDVGALWVGADRLIYWGDGEQFSVGRDELILMERKADKRNSTMLAGVAHIILHVQLPGGGQRQIRLHIEGVWTMGQKRKGMDRLAERIANWHQPQSHPPPKLR